MDQLKNNFLSANVGDADVQDKLYAWLEDKGHVNKLRGYIRKQLIATLKDGSAENDSNKANVVSPTMQAINLLVADFLMNQKYMFALSVFITEVPLLGSLLRFSSYVNSLVAAKPTNPIIKHNYELNEVREILDTLGFRPNSQVVKLTCQYYLHPDKDNLQFNSLLSCLFKAITTIKNNLSKYDKIQNNENISNTSLTIEDDTPEHRLNNFLVSIENILSPFNLNEQQRNMLKNLLKKYHQNNNTEIINDHKKECLQKLELLVKGIAKKVKIVEQYMLQKQQIENDTEQQHFEQKQLYTLINICEEKEKSVRKSEEECKKVLQDMKNQKNELRRKELDILRREKRLKKEPTKLQEQNFDLTKHVQEWKLDKLEAFKMFGFEQTRSNKISNDIQRIDTSLDRELVIKLQRENDELREFIKNQQQRIEELSNRTSNLTNQMEKTHKIQSTVTTNYRDKRNMRKKRNDSSNKKPYTDQNISSTSTTDNSRTVDNQTEDDIIKIARLRLKFLEKNTEEVEQNLNFQKENFLTNRECHNTLTCDKGMITNNRSLHDAIPLKLPFYFHDIDSLLYLKNSDSIKINLGELDNTNRTYRSSSKRSENDTNSKTIHHDINATNNSPSDVHINMLRNSYLDSIDSPINKGNCHTELPMNRSDMSAQTPNESQLQIKMPVVEYRSFANSPELSNTENQTQTKITDNIETHVSQLTVSDNGGRLEENFNVIVVCDSQQTPTTVAWQDKSNDVDSSASKQEGAISFDNSNKTESSSDF